MAEKLTRIDETIIRDHSKLLPSDECYFWREYTSGKNYAFGIGNNLISNLKKKPSRSSAAELSYKSRAINECANFFRDAIRADWLQNATLVPVPGSKIIGHPDHDDRMGRIIAGIRPQPPLDVRQLVYSTQSLPASHESVNGERASIEDLRRIYRIDENLSRPDPRNIAIFDDVITAGVHYRVVHDMLRERFPFAYIVGFFVARRVFAVE